MKRTFGFAAGAALLVGAALALPASCGASEAPPKAPGFSVDYMDKSVDPGTDFYRYADGGWVRSNPVPADKSRWGAFMELQERNWFLIHSILDSVTAKPQPPNSPSQKVADFFCSGMDTNRLEQLGFKPLDADLARIDALKTKEDLARLLADFHQRGVGAAFRCSVSPDARDSEVYALYFSQGGLGLPDRDYYLSPKFKEQRDAYAAHVTKMLTLLGEPPADAKAHSATVLEMETELAQASKARADLRDPIANYHKFSVADILNANPDVPLRAYLDASGQEKLSDLVVRQPEFFEALSTMLNSRPMRDWQTYLRWHLLRRAASYLHAAAEQEAFAFYGKVLSGQLDQEPRWQRVGKVIDDEIGEALGQLFVEQYFPPAARTRMLALVENIKAVFRDRLQKLDWMTEATRGKALAKFSRFTQKIGYPDKFRDYSAVEVRPDDYLGNVQRAEAFEAKRELARVGKPVDRSEWRMTPQTVNAYFNPSQNEIVFPAGILQAPFFDMHVDDAVNYGGIGVVIGHEITHGYDDQGRKFDADGNLNDWWTDADAQAVEARADQLVDQFDAYEVLPGVHVNGKLTLGENIADLGGVSIAYEALERALAKDSSQRTPIDGFTPEQRFFLSFAQVWRTNCRDAEARRLVTVDPHSPGRFRAVGALVNLPQFYEAFGIKAGAPMWRSPELRATIW